MLNANQSSNYGLDRLKSQTYLNSGLSVIPCGEDKRPIGIWKQYQSRPMPSADALTKFQRAQKIGLVCGNVSGNLECIDVDLKYDLSGNLYERLTAAIPTEIFNRFVIQRTINGGYHFFYRCNAIQGNQKLATGTDKNVLIETRGEGGFCIISPSSGYNLIQGNFTDIQTITEADRKTVLDICRSFSAVIIPPLQPVKTKKEYTPKAKNSEDKTPWDDFNEQHSPLNVLLGYNWDVIRTTSKHTEIGRPNQTERSKSGIVTDNVAYIHSTSTPLPTEQNLTAFAIYTWYEHGGDYTRAAADLKSKGYGTQPQPKKNNEYSRQPQYNNSVIKADFYSDKESKIRTRLTDILQVNNLSPVALFGKLWNVPTGTGKTTAIIKAAALQKVAFFAPLTGIVDQVYNDATAAGIDAIKYTGATADRQHLADRINAGHLPQMIVCTYASAESLCRMLDRLTDQFNLVIDEFHSTTAAAAPKFMLRQLNGLLDTACNYKTITGLTGTPLLNLHPVTKDLPQVTIKLTGEPKTATEFIQSADPLQAAADAVQKSIAAGRMPLVLFNNKKEGLNDLFDLLKDTPGLAAFNAETKSSPAFMELLNSGLLCKDIAAVISTTVLEMGINNNGTTPTDVIILGQFHPVTIKQFKERNRLADCRLFVIQKEKTEPTAARYIDRDTEAEKMIRQSESFCSMLNEDRACPYAIAIRKILQSVYIRETAAGFIPDYLAIQNYIFETEKHFLNSSPERLLQALLKYGFEVYNDKNLNIKTDHAVRNDDAKICSMLRRDATKAATAELFTAIATELQGTGLPQLTAERAIKAKDTTAQAKEFYQMFLNIREYCKTDQQAAELFTATDGKESKGKQTVLRLKTKCAIFDSHDIGKAPTEILNTFAAGQRMTAEQLKNTFIACLRTDKTIDIEPFEKGRRIDSILKKLRLFFDVVPYGKTGTDYLIKSLPKEYI